MGTSHRFRIANRLDRALRSLNLTWGKSPAVFKIVVRAASFPRGISPKQEDVIRYLAESRHDRKLAGELRYIRHDLSGFYSSRSSVGLLGIDHRLQPAMRTLSRQRDRADEP
jgi:hypothetical protein